MLHRAVLGSMERFIGILIENFAGDFPFWFNPVQVRVLPISDKFVDYARQLQNQLREEGYTVELDERNEKIGYKIREGEKEKVPYLLVVGEKEQAEGTISVRKRKIGDIGSLTLSDLLIRFKAEMNIAANRQRKDEIA
jgi:threonyl-tRNA synthetase